ncbi:MAG: flavodoxin domain-containing protein [Chitinophagaceae bacterium]
MEKVNIETEDPANNTTMLSEAKLKVLQELVSNATIEELVWINGYLSGIISHQTVKQEVIPAKAGVNKITIVYGTESGNSKKLATTFAAKAKKKGINAKVVSLDQYRVNDLPKEEYFFPIISTQGDGEPPAAAKKFYDHIHQNGFQLNKLKYSVLALGDTSYPLFCKSGEDVDSRLQSLGGSRLLPLQKCDVDFDEDANAWFTNALQVLSSNGNAVATASPVISKKPTGKKTYSGTILTHINLNDRGSNKETYHIEIAAEDVGYKPGDSIGIIPENALATVEAIITLAGIDREKTVGYKNEPVTIHELLHKKLNIVYLPERVVKKYADIVQQDIPATRMDLLDLLRIYPVKNAAQFKDVIGMLEPITPRLYSIASSPEAHNGEVHITVARNYFDINNEIKYGLASDFLSRLNMNTGLPYYVHPNTQFRLPEEDKDIIMIGPGTGIAPFRSFIAHRDAIGASGRNWLFFGEQHFASDFLYQTEIQNWVETGVLTKVNVAFSRDQKEKVYVQHKMLQEGETFYEWLESGAYVYVCGTKDPMSIDVENTLLQIVKMQGIRSEEEAIQYLDDMKEDGRYLKDVY